MRDLRLAHDRAAALAAEKEQEVTVAREAIVARDHQLQESARVLAERTAAYASLDQLKCLRDTELTAAKQELAVQEIALKASRSQTMDLAAKVTELEQRLDRDEDTIKELCADLTSWQERKQRVLGLIATRLGNANGSWRRLSALRKMNRAEALLAGSLIGESRLAAHFDQPIFGDVDEGEVRFTGWCLHPARELANLSLRLNDVPFPTRFGLDRPDVGAAFPHAPGSAHSGFLISAPIKPGRYLVTLEAHCRDLGPEMFVAPDLLVVKRRPAWKRMAAALERNVGFWSYAASKLRRRLAHGRGLPSWQDVPAQVRRARQEFLRRGGSGSALRPPDGFTPPAPVDSYEAWLADNPWGPSQEADLRHRLKLARNLPKISVVTPVYRPDLRYFQQTADSVCGQVYENWEWCLADDCSNDEGLTAKLRELAARDARVRFVTRPENGHISVATNSAAELAHGEYIALMDHDDLLSPDCLAEVALYLAAHPDVDVLYTDDDKVDIEGRRYGPQFKPDWSPESLLSQMYFSHLLVVRRSLYEQVGGMRAGFEGSQDHDLALRAVEKARSVAHLPLILYHWRAVPGSTALSGEAKMYSFDAGIRAVSEALARRGVPAEVDRPDWAVQARASLLRHGFPDDGPRVAILIATRNQVKLLDRCVQSLAKTRYRNFETIVLDDHSDEPETIAWLASFPGTVLRVPGRREGFNFSALHNHAARSVDAEYLLFLNNDTEVLSPEWLSQMVGFARLQGVGAVGARLLFPDDTVQHAGILHGFNQGSLALAFRGLPREHPGYLAAARVCRNYGAVTAACMLTPRRLFLELGGFDEGDFAVSFNDVDYCYRLLDHGYRCVYAAEAELYHHEGATRGIGSRVEEVARFRQRYGQRGEPYYNPNLSTTSEHFEVRPRRLARRTDRPVKALMASHTLDLTGAPFCQFEMAAALRAKGRLDPIVISPEDGPLRSLYEECGIPVRILPNGMEKVGSLADYERELAEFARQVLDADVEVIYGNTLKTFYAIDAARRLNLPSLWNIRESEPWQTYYNYLPDAVACRALECFSFPYRVLFVSNASRAVFEPLNSRHNFQVIHDGLDLERWEARLGKLDRPTSRHKLGVSADELVVVLLGTVCERKGQHDLVKALAQLPPEIAGRLRCFIVGDRPGDYSRRLAGLVHQLPAAVRHRVHVVPETRDVACYYQAADLFVCTSRVESYPRVTLEAMACGLPIISTPVFGLSEQLVDQVNALLYQPGDIAALVAALARLAGDAALREAMGARSRAVLAGLKSFDEMAEDYGIQFMEVREAR
jgi:GT2 family glycosyltransferase